MLRTRTFQSLKNELIRQNSPTRRFLASKPDFYDLTSDTATEVTDDMFDIMRSASRKDDVFGVCIVYD